MHPHVHGLEALMKRKRIFSIADAAEDQVSASSLAYHCKAGRIRRLGRGLYCPAGGGDDDPYPELTLLAHRGSEFVVCLLSALRLHGFTTQLPCVLWIAIPQRSRLPRIDPWPVSCIRLNPGPYAAGIETLELPGGRIRVYSPAKTVADCFKFRNRIGLDVALEALRDGHRKGLFTISELMESAAVCRVSRIIVPYVQSLLA